MRSRFLFFALLAALLCPRGGVQAQVLPPPRVLPPAGAPQQVIVSPFGMTRPVLPPAGKPMPGLPLAASPYPVPGYQPSAYQVWQNYGWTHNGWIRPRVIQTNNGGYWLYNGAPFPYVYVLPGRQFSTIAPASAPGP